MEENKTTEKSKNSKSSLLSKGISLSILTLGSRVMGLIREIVKAKFLGTSVLGDAFGVAFQIPNLFRRLFAENSISVAFIPTFKDYLEDSNTPDGKETTQRFISATFTLVSFLTTVVVVIGIIAAPLILRIYYRDKAGEGIQEALILTRIMFPYLIVISVAALFQGILNGIKIFSPSGFTPILFNGIVIAATYILAPYTANEARAMSIGVITGGCVQALFQLPFVIKHDWKITFTSLKEAFTNEGTRRVIRLVIPTIFGMACYQLNEIVSSSLATHAGIGIYSALSYSLRLQELILGIFAVTIGTVILPDLTGFAKKEQWTEFTGMVTTSVKLIAVIAIPVTFYAFCMGENIISLVFSIGRFDADSVALTTAVFRYHIVGLFFIAANRILSPAFYAQENTKLPTLAGIINFAINIAVAFLFVSTGYFSKTPALKGQGIALALSIASAVNTVVLFLFLKKTKASDTAKIVKPVILYSLKIILFSIIALIPVVLLKGKIINLFSGHNRLISHGGPVFVTAIIFAVIGIGLLVVTKDSLIKMISKKVK